MSRAASALRTAGALALGLLLSAGMAELAVTALVGEQVRFPRHVVAAPWGLRYNQPGAEYGHHSPDVDVRFRINAQGMRADRDYAYAKPPGRQRILSLGDSFTAGYEVEVEESFSAVLEETLRARGADVEVLNAGVSGFSTAEAYLYLERELWKYRPDVVVVSFFGNDLVDNVRTGLFAVEDGRLVPRAERYVPGGRLGDLLNTNPVLAWLSEHSNAFALVKERVNVLLKQQRVQENLENLEERTEEGGAADGHARTRRRERQEALAAALFEALYQAARARDVPLVIHSIPTQVGSPPRLVDAFPRERLDLERPGLAYLSSKEVLEPHLGEELLYWTRSHWHWTPVSHRLAGEALADRILARGFVEAG